jgi:hypothetical protein
MRAELPGYEASEGAPASAVEALRRQYPSLPAEYLDFLRNANGAQGSLGIPPGSFSLWSAGNAPRFNVEHEVFQNLPGHFGIGSSLGGELFVLKLRGSAAEKAAVYRVPFIPMEESEILEVAETFAAFAAAMGKRIA